MMNIQEYLDKMREIQKSLIQCIDDNDTNEESFLNLKKLIIDQKINDEKYDLKTFLNLFLRISNNHHCSKYSLNNIIEILQFLKNDIIKYFSNDEIFNIFKDNKRILLYLIEEKIIIINKTIASKLMKEKYEMAKYPQYFFNEIKSFIDEQKIDKISKEIPEDFEEKRKIGENDNFICELIRNDLINDFISYVSKSKINLKRATIEQSIFETNQFLLKKKQQITLIEYATFFGSIQIFKYLINQKVDLRPSVWLFAIHGSNSEIIHFLEEKHIEPDDRSFKKCIKESIKCHHNDLANYFINNLDQSENEILQNFSSKYVKYYNFEFFQEKMIDSLPFYNFCKWDYANLVKILLLKGNIDVNKYIIFILL